MICNKCGKEIDNDSKFCTYCGAIQEEVSLEGKQSVEVEQTKQAEEVQEIVEEQQAQEVQEVVEEEQAQEVQEVVEEEQAKQTEETQVLPEEDKRNFSDALFSNEFEYTKKIFNRYYRAEFLQRSLGGYITLQVLLTFFFFVPGVLFAIIYWAITNPITKASQWRNFLFDNKGNQPLYRYFFNEDSLLVRRNRVEECVMQYKDFKKIVYTKDGIIFLSKSQDFFIPLEELKNKEEVKEILANASNTNFKCKVKN